MFILLAAFPRLVFSISPTALRPNPFQLVKEEADKTFSADKDEMTVGVAESPEFNLPIGAITTNFWSFITPFLSSGQAGSGGSGSSPGLGFFANGSCPIPNGEGFLLCGSYTTADDSSACFHGSNLYWQSNGLCTNDWCSQYPNQQCCVNNYPVRWAIPILDKPACWTNPYSDSLAYSPNSTCQNYGYAADFAYSDLKANAPVALPEINGQSLNWELKTTYPLTSSGAGGILVANDGTNVYEISLYHLNEPITAGGVSGQQIGTLFQFAPGVSNPHVHLELMINGEMVKPDNLCQ